jgi:tetratricopeptide (TPR) repeat protein
MVNYMLGKLEMQTRQFLTLQNKGGFSAAMEGYAFVLEVLRFYEELGYAKEADTIRRLILEAQPSPALALYCLSLTLFHQQHDQSAKDAVDAAILLTPEMPLFHVLQARILASLGDLKGAMASYEHAQLLDPASNCAREAYFSIMVQQEMSKDDYYDWLKRLHQWLQPASYIEIGIGGGRSLALAGPKTCAIGIDPYQGTWKHLNYVCPHGAATLFPLTSDSFFSSQDLRNVINRETFDLAFIDGLHLFEQSLKDFINLERYARKDSVILIHDCLPIVPLVAERERCTGFWTGDVWRIIPCLKTFRPDLTLVTIPTKASGLGLVTNLDSTSTVLTDNYNKIVEYYLTLHCPEQYDERCVVCNVVPADEQYIRTLLSSAIQ